MAAGDEIVQMIREIRAKSLERRTECEQCAWPLNEHPTKGLHCSLCGWTEFPYRRKTLDDS